MVNNFQEEMEFSKVVEKVKIIFFVGNVTSIKITNIILNAIIVEVNFVLNVLKIIIMFLIILVLYVEKNSPEDTEFSEVMGKIKIIFFAGNVTNIKATNIILNAKIVEVNFVLLVLKIK